MANNQILDLPRELLSNVLSSLIPREVLRFGSTSHAAYAFVSPTNQILWRAAFLQTFDNPEDAWSASPKSYRSPRHHWDWFVELRARLRALKAIQRGWSLNDDVENAESHINALLSLIDTAKSCPTPTEFAQGKVPRLDDRNSLNLDKLGNIHDYYIGIDKLIHDTRYAKSNRTCDMVGTIPGRPVTRSMSFVVDAANIPESASRLHVLHGMTVRERRDHRYRGTARRKVYNWSLTSPGTDYGPFSLDGKGAVNWSLLEGICSAITRCFEMCVGGHIAMPQGPAYSIPYRTLIDPTAPQDWARVTGSWLGTYSFLDYADLFAFNTGLHNGQYPMLDDEPEACGDLMKLDLRLDPSVKNDPKLQTKVPINYDLPPLYFIGQSAESDFPTFQRPRVEVKGLVSLLPSGREVRWKFIIAYNGSDQWQLEGVQPGGIRGGGVYGMWSQCDHEENAPIGPFCYFPMELCKSTSIVLAG